MERTYLTLTLDSAVIGALLIFFGAFLLGLWCGRMWWGAGGATPTETMSEGAWRGSRHRGGASEGGRPVTG
jgi:hypothetical protein